VRGLKRNSGSPLEIATPSHPSRVRGLKPYLAQGGIVTRPVAPLAGAWIETLSLINCSLVTGVAPLAGAWIETFHRMHR